MRQSVHLDLDGAWEESTLGLPRLDERRWGPRLRYIARRDDVESFWNEVKEGLGKVVLYGSGDFHHLAGVLIRRVATTPFTLVSFDNHPDWDIRPPYWSCGGWAARTLGTGRVQRVSVWGCGNFELRWPARLFADRKALRAGTLQIQAWSERQPPPVQARFACMTRENWRQRFTDFARTMRGLPTYVTVDMDCLRAEEAATNWENGLFTASDVAWAIDQLAQAQLLGGDICGAYSEPHYARRFQRFAGRWDHPAMPAPDISQARQKNLHSLQSIWEAMTAAVVGG
jgi:hypothetical protein